MTTSNIDPYRGVAELASKEPELWTRDACGVTRTERGIPALLHRDAYAHESEKARVLLVGGLSGRADDVALAFQALDLFADTGGLRGRLALSAVPCGNPDGLELDAAPGNGAGGNPGAGYPPSDNFFFDDHDPESRYLWRWISFQAPDFVLEVLNSESVMWEAFGLDENIVLAVGASIAGPDGSLLGALSEGKPSGLAAVPGLRLSCPSESLDAELKKLWSALANNNPGSSPARNVLAERRRRSPLEVARILGAAYGDKLDPVIYTQGVGVSGRLRLAQLDSQSEHLIIEVKDLVEPYVSGDKPAFEDNAGGASLAGIVWAEELFEITGDKRYADLILSVADRYRIARPEGVPAPADIEYRVEDMFYNGAILGRAYKVSDDAAYLDILTKFLLDAGVQQDDGLFWHDRDAPWFWGRGNGFAALGYAETLSYLPQDHPDRQALIDMHARHLTALVEKQSAAGGWLEVIDFPGSYQELSVTCQVGYAMARGMRLGYLDSSYEDSLMAAWHAVNERIDDGGGLVDVCTGTGVQASTRDYLDRPAIFGLDDRGGSLAIWFAVEMMRYLSGDG